MGRERGAKLHFIRLFALFGILKFSLNEMFNIHPTRRKWSFFDVDIFLNFQFHKTLPYNFMVS